MEATGAHGARLLRDALSLNASGHGPTFCQTEHRHHARAGRFNSCTHSAILVTNTVPVLLGCGPPSSPFPEPLASDHPCRGRQQAAPVRSAWLALSPSVTTKRPQSLNASFSHAFSLLFPLLDLAWATQPFLSLTSPTLARTYPPSHSLVFGSIREGILWVCKAASPSGKSDHPCRQPPASRWRPQLPACRRSRHEARRSPARQPEKRTGLVNRLYEGGTRWNKKHRRWKEPGESCRFFFLFRSAAGVPFEILTCLPRHARGLLSLPESIRSRSCRQFDLSSPSQHLHLRPTAPPITLRASVVPVNNCGLQNRYCSSATTTALTPPSILPRLLRCGRTL